ncbi:tetratricopeptide repeat protein, partial [Candidatus Saccharibacteria bacterium]|nr:tetratricopeptide repeat protein [Candidatus Saccharibacteria bacterium]NIW78808.1 tetratricopeptide repeat protein [Calditrichia bacterium]
MHEMLGNQLFLVRNYTRAAETLEKALRKKPKDKAIRRKLIVCYTQIGEVKKALQLFMSLANEDIDFIINIDPIEDDCPCPEIVYDMEAQLDQNQNSVDFQLNLGMLWLFCDIHKSIAYFKQAQKLDPQ